MITRNKLAVIAAVGLVWSSTSNVIFGETADDNSRGVSREEYNQLLKRSEQLEKQMQEVREKMAQPPAAPTGVPAATPTGAVTRAAFDGLKSQVEHLSTIAQTTFPGTNKFLIAGYGAAGFTDQEHGGDRLFEASFNPLLLWKLSDRLLFEGELEFELEENETSTALEQAHLAYLLNDYMTFDAGKFLNPMDAFVERYHMAWVNRLPDKPLAVYDGLLPESLVGAQVRGGIPIESAKLNYAVFVANAPALNTDTNDDPGTLTFENFDNGDRHFVNGGHVGLRLIPELEIGYGVMAGEVGPSGEPNVKAVLQSVDLSSVMDSRALSGLVRFNAQWVWSRVDPYAFGIDDFDNNRDGGYAQIAYRPTHLHQPLLSKLEPVFRYDVLNQMETPTGFDEQRNTLGLNYWLTSMTVFKAAYEWDNRDGDTDHNALLLQFATGF